MHEHRPGLRFPAWAERWLDWTRAREKAILIGAAVFHLAVLAGMTLPRAQALAEGETLRVRVVPVDPRDLFRGEYVILNYAFSQTDGSLPHPAPGQVIYAVLRRSADGVHWEADRFSLAPPGATPFLRGKVVSWGRIEYGIESFFVQEGRGREYEEAARRGTLSAEISVRGDGQAMLRRLHVGR